MLRPPLEGRDMVEFPPPNLSQTSDFGEQFQFDQLSLSDSFSPGNTGTSRPSSGGCNSSRNRPHNHQKQPSPPVIGARRSLSDNMNQAATNGQGHPLPPPQRHVGGYYSQSSSTSSQGSLKSGGGGQLQGAWATPGKSGATVVKSGSISRNLSLNRDLSLSPRVVGRGGGGGGGGSSCGTASPMFSLSRHSSTSSLTSSGSVTPASSGTRTPVTSQPRGSHYALISSSASKLEKMKREDAMSSQQYSRNSGGRGGGRGGGYPLKHSVSGPEMPDASRRWKRTQSQQVLYQGNDYQRGNVTPRRNMSSQNFQQMRGHERSRPGAGISRPLSEGFDSGAQAQTSNHETSELQPRSYSDSQRRSPGGVRRSNQQSQTGRNGYYQKGHQSSRGRGATGRGNRGRGRDKYS